MIRLGACSLLVLFTFAYATDCPGGLVRCPDYMTCCELANREYGCCPFPNAQCCMDHVHCCPQDMQCDVSQQTCRKNGLPVHFYWKVPIQPELIEPKEELPTEPLQEYEDNTLDQFKENDDKCPDGHPCPSVYTCCKMYAGGYGCCPFSNAECCSDGFHCCPVGTHCNKTTGGCDHKTHKFFLDSYPLPVKKVTKLPQTKAKSQPQRAEVSDPGGKCPDGHPCPDKYTCCKVPDQGYSCCPYTDAVCCTDYIHCCPKGTNCNTTLGTCDVSSRKSVSVPAFSLVTKKLETPKAPALPNPTMNATTVKCPDERWQCPDKSTCCQLSSGAYGCCLMDHAVCCSDHEHCCPNGFECITGGCVKRTEQDESPLLHPLLPAQMMVQREPLHPVESLKIVVCPDQMSTCPDGNTCCDIGFGMYGCCPMSQATCCSDKEHCCPHGYRCTSQGCERSSTSDNLPLFALNVPSRSEDYNRLKTAVEVDPIESVVCPNKEYRCPDENTCCKIGGGQYGCCPMPEATCCSDMEHCCPHGYSCGVDGCEKNPGSPFSLPPFTRKVKITIGHHENTQDIPQVMLLP